jgi:hypothetical protein
VQYLAGGKLALPCKEPSLPECCPSYTHSDFVGYACGIGNKRGDVLRDPRDPIGQARALGRELVETGCRIDSERPGSIWAGLGVQS